MDSVIFTITNLGIGDMECYRPLRIYIDCVVTDLDSVLLNSGGEREWESRSEKSDNTIKFKSCSKRAAFLWV